MRESGYSEDLIFDFDGLIAEMVMHIDAKAQEREERPAPSAKKDPTVQVLKYAGVEDVFAEIETNVREREALGPDGIAALANTEELESVAEMIRSALPVRF